MSTICELRTISQKSNQTNINFEEQTHRNHLSIALFTSFGLKGKKKLIIKPERELYTQQRHLLGELTNSTDAM